MFEFEPTWESIENYQVPEWFRDAKLGMWAHWGPQCQPETSDWYARNMYLPGSWQYKHHVETYGHPGKVGFKDIIHEWKAEEWNPTELVELYKSCGAKYFMAMANHHDNLDMWDSEHQPWNSVNVGPKKNIIKGWHDACRAAGLPFGVSVHAAHAWSWYEPAQGSDEHGSFDGKLTKEDGKGTWWEGLDPQDLYEQRHTPSPDFMVENAFWGRWEWDNGCSIPNEAYCQRIKNRTLDLFAKYQPDLVYFDDTVLPLWPISDIGLELAANFYNLNLKKTGGASHGVLFGKVLDEVQRKCMVWDIERGQTPVIEPLPFQTDTCLGDWHYHRQVFIEHRYKSPATVLQMMIDVVSKNGCFLLSVPVRGNGSIDSDTRNIVLAIGEWMKANGDAIYATRPWEACGEGPSIDEAKAINKQGFNEGIEYGPKDVRYTKKGEDLFAFVMEPHRDAITLTKLAGQKVASVERVNTNKAVAFQTTGSGLVLPGLADEGKGLPVAYRIRFA